MGFQVYRRVSVKYIWEIPVYRKDGQIIENAPREFIKDLDTLCFPH